MNLNEQCEFSYYVPVAPINEEHKVWLVQHAETGKFYVRKTTQFYNAAVFRYLQSNPIPNMPRIFALFEDANTLHIIEEYISGNTLDELLGTYGKFPEHVVTQWLHQLCNTVQHLHNCTPPIIHRDIKPSNIILTHDGRIVLLDLSAARQDAENKSQDTVIMGTAGYAAPEQYGFTSSSQATDIYSIGILMNKLLTGKLLSEQIYTGELSGIISKCTQLDPSKRYRDVAQLDRDLLRHIDIPKEKQVSKWAYLPPGFRSGKLVVMAFSLLGYLFLLSITLTMTSRNSSPRAMWATRLAATTAVLGIIFFSGNYLNCQSQLPLSRSKNIFVRLAGILLWDAVFFLGCVIVSSFFY